MDMETIMKKSTKSKRPTPKPRESGVKLVTPPDADELLANLPEFEPTSKFYFGEIKRKLKGINSFSLYVLQSHFEVGDLFAAAKVVYERETGVRHGRRNPQATETFAAKAARQFKKEETWVYDYLALSKADKATRKLIEGSALRENLSMILAVVREHDPECRGRIVDAFEAGGSPAAKVIVDEGKAARSQRRAATKEATEAGRPISGSTVGKEPVQQAAPDEPPPGAAGAPGAKVPPVREKVKRGAPSDSEVLTALLAKLAAVVGEIQAFVFGLPVLALLKTLTAVMSVHAKTGQFAPETVKPLLERRGLGLRVEALKGTFAKEADITETASVRFALSSATLAGALSNPKLSPADVEAFERSLAEARAYVRGPATPIEVTLGDRKEAPATTREGPATQEAPASPEGPLNLHPVNGATDNSDSLHRIWGGARGVC